MGRVAGALVVLCSLLAFYIGSAVVMRRRIGVKWSRTVIEGDRAARLGLGLIAAAFFILYAYVMILIISMPA